MSYSTRTPPFSYSGGKSQLAPQIVNLFKQHFPSENHLVSPFVGGAAVELLHLHARGGFCHAADADPHVVLLWQHLIADAKAVAKAAYPLLPLTEEMWRAWYAEMMSTEWHSVEHAARYYLLRYSRVVHAWNVWVKRMEQFNQPKVHRPALSRLAQFRVARCKETGEPKMTVEQSDFQDFLAAHDGICYCDPPYYSDDKSYEKVYEKRGAADDNIFSNADHEALAELLCARKGWVLSYSPHDWVKSRYRDYIQHEVNVTYASRSAQQKNNRDKEVLIVCPM